MARGIFQIIEALDNSFGITFATQVEGLWLQKCQFFPIGLGLLELRYNDSLPPYQNSQNNAQWMHKN